jgi:PIN domain nuclease of toxin-antitoxin system
VTARAVDVPDRGTERVPADPRPLGPPYLLDTHVWVWYLIGSPRLPAGLRAAIDDAIGELWLSPISIWELGALHARGRIEFRDGLRAWCAEARRTLPVSEAHLTAEVALGAPDVDLPHDDPADRLLASTAIAHGLTILTVDERLVASAGVPTRSG